MTIYAVTKDVDAYQYLLSDDADVRKLVQFDCQRLKATWVPPTMYVYKPKNKRGNFLGVSMGGAFACDEETRYHDQLAELLEMSGELLPIMIEGEEKPVYAINALDCVNALDRDNSEWHPATRQGKIGMPQTYVFHRARIPETPLFKIPETSKSQVLCAEGAHDPDYEFKRLYARLGLTGLLFEKLWSDEE